MRIKNESQRMFYFNGGCLAPGKAADIQDVKVAEALVKGYPGEIISLDDVEVTVIPAVKEEAPVEEAPVEEPKEEKVEKISRKSKKSK